MTVVEFVDEINAKAKAAVHNDLVTDKWIEETIEIQKKAEEIFGCKTPTYFALKELQARREAEAEQKEIMQIYN